VNLQLHATAEMAAQFHDCSSTAAPTRCNSMSRNRKRRGHYYFRPRAQEGRLLPRWGWRHYGDTLLGELTVGLYSIIENTAVKVGGHRRRL